VFGGRSLLLDAKKFHGVITAVMNPYEADGRIAEKPLRDHVEFLIGAGVHGLYPCGSAGECAVLDSESRKRIAEIVIDQTSQRVPVMVHVGASSTEETGELATHALEIGADAIGVVTPYYYPYTSSQLARHFTEVAQAVPSLPVFLYNIPGNAMNEISPELAGQLVREVPNIMGLKDSSKSISKLLSFLHEVASRGEVLVGSDELILPAVAAGAVGVISALSNVIPELVVALFNASVSGDIAKAQKLQHQVIEIRNILKRGPNIGGYKFAIRWRGNTDFKGMVSPGADVDENEAHLIAEGLERQVSLGVLQRTYPLS
jgi:4-hydroxy-tetrahydrodipicolinate synthase